MSTLAANEKKGIAYHIGVGISKYSILITKCLRSKITEIRLQNDGRCWRVLENCVYLNANILSVIGKVKVVFSNNILSSISYLKKYFFMAESLSPFQYGSLYRRLFDIHIFPFSNRMSDAEGLMTMVEEMMTKSLWPWKSLWRAQLPSTANWLMQENQMSEKYKSTGVGSISSY